MADHVQIATDEIGGVHYQRTKIAWGADGAANDADRAAPVPITQYPPGTPFQRFLDTNGDGTGTKNGIGNYSAGLTDFFILPASGLFLIEKLLYLVRDGTAALTIANYGAVAGPLTNGVLIHKRDAGSLLIDFTDGDAISDNGELMERLQNTSLPIAGSLRGEIIFPGGGLVLDSASSERLTVRLNDDFTGLDRHVFIAVGQALA